MLGRVSPLPVKINLRLRSDQSQCSVISDADADWFDLILWLVSLTGGGETPALVRQNILKYFCSQVILMFVLCFII